MRRSRFLCSARSAFDADEAADLVAAFLEQQQREQARHASVPVGEGVDDPGSSVGCGRMKAIRPRPPGPRQTRSAAKPESAPTEASSGQAKRARSGIGSSASPRSRPPARRGRRQHNAPSGRPPPCRAAFASGSLRETSWGSSSAASASNPSAARRATAAAPVPARAARRRPASPPPAQQGRPIGSKAACQLEFAAMGLLSMMSIALP